MVHPRAAVAADEFAGLRADGADRLVCFVGEVEVLVEIVLAHSIVKRVRRTKLCCEETKVHLLPRDTELNLRDPQGGGGEEARLHEGKRGWHNGGEKHEVGRGVVSAMGGRGESRPRARAEEEKRDMQETDQQMNEDLPPTSSSACSSTRPETDS